jgi:5'-nucleotidase
MRFLVTNDDGYLAPGIGVLARVAARLGEVDVVAPDREQSATSHSLTMHRPLRVRTVREGTRVVDGTPTDCVVLALGELLDRPADFVLSGINHGSNLGDDVLYSGTVAAAMEATILGIPAVAVSFAAPDPDPPLDDAWEDLLAELLGRIVRRDGFPQETLLNVNLPPVPARDVKGTRVTVLGRRAYEDSLTRATDPSGREYFWIGGGESRWWGSERSDFEAVRDGYVSVTPLHLDLTNHRLLKDLERWDLGAP